MVSLADIQIYLWSFVNFHVLNGTIPSHNNEQRAIYLNRNLAAF